jgi:hypothetical protein
MKKCAHYTEQIIDLLENQLTNRARGELLGHIEHCAECAQEYKKLQKLNEVMNRDELTLPPEATFERIKLAARMQVAYPRRRFFRQLLKVSLPVFALTAMLLIFLRPRVETVEMSIPVANLLEDEEIAEFAIAGIVSTDILHEIDDLEEQFFIDTEEAIGEMSKEEKNELVRSLYRKYAIGI